MYSIIDLVTEEDGDRVYQDLKLYASFQTKKEALAFAATREASVAIYNEYHRVYHTPALLTTKGCYPLYHLENGVSVRNARI